MVKGWPDFDTRVRKDFKIWKKHVYKIRLPAAQPTDGN